MPHQAPPYRRRSPSRYDKTQSATTVLALQRRTDDQIRVISGTRLSGKTQVSALGTK